MAKSPSLPPPHAIDRPELRARLDHGVQSPLTLLVAPAGAGKTVLLAQWASSVRHARVVWLDMTDADDDPMYFVKRFIAELRSTEPGPPNVDILRGNVGAGLGESLLEALAAMLSESSATVVVIFDDLHRVTNRDLLADLWRLVDMLPPNVRFVFSSRFDLKLGWSRHRLRHGLVELRQADLVLDPETAARMLARITGLPVDLAAATTVVERMEGWAAGVQLTGLSLRFRSDAAPLLEALNESDRLAIDYLSEEVLQNQTPERRRALLRLSVLEEMDASVVEIVTGEGGGADLLDELERESMFVAAVPGRPGRYRFHHLFRELLRLRLRAMDAGLEGRLLAEVAEWHLAHADFAAAIDHFLAANRWDRAMSLILSRGREVYEVGESATVARWLWKIPGSVRRSSPDAEVLLGMVELMSGRAAVAEQRLRGVIADSDAPAEILLVARAFLSACVQFRPHPDVYLREGHRAQELASTVRDAAMPDLLHLTDLALVRTVTDGSVARAHLLMGDLPRAVEMLRQLLTTPGATYAPFRIHALGSLALAEGHSGRLVAARELSEEALELARELGLLLHPATADAYLARSLVAIQRGEPEAGAFALQEGYLRASANRRTQLMWMAHMQSRLVDPQGTDSATVSPPGSPPPLVRDILAAITRRLQRQSGRPGPSGRGRVWSPIVFEDIAGSLVRGEIEAARSQMDGVTFPNPPTLAQHVEADVLRAWILAEEGRASVSQQSLVRALETAAPEELVHPFLRAGGPVIALLKALPGVHRDFRRAILSRWKPDGRIVSSELIEPLTVRELELLAYLPSRLTNAELAARCFVSVNTVKTHIAHIYRKLDAPGRDAAVARARELGLLAPVDMALLE